MLILGEPCIDVIHKADGKVYNEHGGISYSIVASAMLDDGIETIPVIPVCREDRAYFDTLLTRLSSVDLSGIYEVGAPVRRVDLFYENENNRWECSTLPVEPTPFGMVGPFLPAEGIHVNLISGDEVSPDTLSKIKAAAPDAHIHLDLHNIVMQRQPDGKRIRTARPDYVEWSRFADTVQMNEEEAEIIDPGAESHRQLAKRIFETGPRALAITLAEKGLVLYEKVNKGIQEYFFQPHKVNVIDPTGSGDVFGATFLHGILLGKSNKEAAEAGVVMAAKKVEAAGPTAFLNLKRTGADAG